MSNWKAALPREAPPAGKTHTILGMRTAAGFRCETTGTVPDDQARFARAILLMDHARFLRIASGEEKLVV